MKYEDIFNPDLTEDEFAKIIRERKKKYDKQRPDAVYNCICKHAKPSMDGVFCTIGEGSAYRYCWAYYDKECPFYKPMESNDEKH